MAALIRLAEPGDGPALADIYRPAVTDCATSFELDPPDGDEMARRAVRCMERTPWLVYERDGVVIGYAYAGTHRERAAYQWSVEVSAYVHHAAHRQGIGRALYASLFAALVVQGFRRSAQNRSAGAMRSTVFTLVRAITNSALFIAGSRSSSAGPYTRA